MDKKFYVLSAGTKGHKTFEDAAEQAKRYAGRPNGYGDDKFIIAEGIAFAKSPVPDVEIVKMEAQASA